MWEIADAVEFITAVLRGFQPDIKRDCLSSQVGLFALECPLKSIAAV